MIAGLCSEPFVLEIMRIVNTVISLLRIIVPLILIIIIMVNVGKGIAEGEDALNKAIKGSISKIIAALLIFLVPVIVVTIFKLTLPNNEFLDCLTVKTKEDINNVYIDRIENNIKKAEQTLSVKDYDSAKGLLTRIKDEEKKKEYTEKLSQIEDNIYIKEAEGFIAKAEESLDASDYLAAYEYLNNVKDATKKEEYSIRLAMVKSQIDSLNIKPTLISTGYGSNITATDEIKTACGYVLEQDTVRIQLRTCTDQYQYQNPSNELPGGANYNGSTYYAKETIPFSKYKMGLFFGEIPPDYSTDNFLDTFAVMYTTVILANTVPRQIRRGEANIVLPTVTYTAGSCAQNYRESLYRSRYESGQFKEKIDQIMDETKYFILVNDDGELTDVRYNTRSGILDVMKKAAKENKDLLGMVEALKSGHELAHFYSKANVYDCRNLAEGQAMNEDVDISKINRNIIYLGDSRIQAFRNIKDDLGFDDSRESIYARFSTGYDDYFKSHMNSAKSEMNSHKDKSYAVTVNYGVNAKRTYPGFCDYYQGYVKNMDPKNQFYIVSVNPFDEAKVKYYKDDNTNAKVEKFNDYMKNTCIPLIKEKAPNSQVFYCDVYGSISLDEWSKRGYVGDDGIHYTTAGSKYIYNEIKKCVAKNSK